MTQRYPGWDKLLGGWAHRTPQWRERGKHRGGFADKETGDVYFANMWGLCFADLGVMIVPLLGSGGNPIALRWKDIDSIVIEGLDKDRVNKAALVGFGLLGVGAKVKQTGVLIRTGDRELVFQMDGSEFDWKNGLRPLIQTHSEAADKIHFGAEPAEPAEPATHEDPIEQLERLGQLLERGLIDQTEFQSMKRDIIG